MATSKTSDKPTPNGGVRSEMIFLKNGVLCDESEATAAEIVEYDAADSVVFRTYMTKTPADPEAPRG